MAITKTWSIETLERNPSDGFVVSVHWILTGKDGDTIIKERGGSIQFVKPSSLPSEFIAYDSLDEATVISWVKDSLGTTLIAEWEDAVVVTTEWGKPF